MSDKPSLSLRKKILHKHGARGDDVQALLDYNQNVFNLRNSSKPLVLPLQDELFVETWQRYAGEAESGDLFRYLAGKLVQLRFPIRTGMSADPTYRAVVREGKPPREKRPTGFTLTAPNRLRLVLAHSLAGRIPVLSTSSREDFAALIQALTMRNEPKPIPPTQGACTIAGYVNWDRAHQQCAIWRAENEEVHLDLDLVLGLLWPRESLYRDCLILTRDGPYSGVPASVVGCDEFSWRRLSNIIRLEHECTHYLTHRIFGIMRNNAKDELMADFVGMIAAFGTFKADTFLHFMGLADHQSYMPGSRLDHYRGNPSLSDDAFAVLRSLLVHAAENLEQFSNDYRVGEVDGTPAITMLLALAGLTLEEIASSESQPLMEKALGAACALVQLKSLTPAGVIIG